MKVLKAAWVLPISGDPIENACLIIKDGIIEKIISANELGRVRNKYEVYDYGDAIILPGFINLHTHLEHTKLRYLAKETPFLEWLPKLMEATANWSFDNRLQSAQCGIEESIKAGTTFVVDSSYNGASIKPLAESGLRALVGLETFGLDESLAKIQWQQWLERYDNLISDKAVSTAMQEERLRITASPHAPYTVCPSLWREALEWTRLHKLPLLTHLCESKEEFNWFNSEDSHLKQFLIYAFSKRIADFDQLYESQIVWKNPNRSPVKHLAQYGLLTDNLIAAHVVQVNNQDIALLKEASVAVAHCPSSNITLKCGRAPLEKFLANKIPVGLGTDSAASSNNLSLLSEANMTIELHKSYKTDLVIDAHQAIELITIKAAQCLGLDDKLGSLDPGKWADIAVFTLDKNSIKGRGVLNPYGLLVQGLCQLKDLFVNGQSVYRN